MMEESIISIQNLTKFYSGSSKAAINRISLDIRKGSIFGLLGPNGAGKTTMIRILCGLLPYSDGEVTICNFSLKNQISEIKNIIGVVPQEIALYPSLTALENLTIFGGICGMKGTVLKKRMNEMLSLFGLEKNRNVQVARYSRGMKRRLNLAMALVHQPDVVVLDEPSEGLDPQSRRVLWKYISSLRDDEGKTVILTTHLMDEADRLSDRVAIIDHGKLLRLDTPDNLKKEIGEGDVVELTLDDKKMNQEVTSILSQDGQFLSVNEVDGKINLRGLNALSKIPSIMELLEKKDIRVADMSMRQNTLEDVFIELTGTRLRE
jgi:ABC-2 type transport system ATP-binding protein